MVKRILACILCLILTIGVYVYAAETQTETADTSAPSNDMQMPQGGKGSRGMGGPRPDGEMGMPPEGMPMGDGEVPTPPPDMQSNTEGENSEFTPPNGFEGGRGGFHGSTPPSGNWQQPSAEQDTAQTSTGSQSVTEFLTKYATPLFSMVLLVLAFVFVIFYKRKNY